MTGCDNYAKRWRKAVAVTLIIFSLIWIGGNLTVILGVEHIKEGNILDIVSQRYQNCSKMLAILIPNIYALVFYYIFELSDAHIILSLIHI